ncbi:fibroblast growth factor-binding protein 2 [Macaca thibetana thibetana]|uniref:fibroblast growth factor-binding protein 2 n=1 Tax=Macaca thibetana thibetana TaxID=257877 RepID=UPI0021BCED63|nr:fibroblast growth factor-binding protein 2 [Macaca thibetana thibetana]
MKFIPCLLLVTLSCLGTLGQTPRQKQGSTGEEFHFQTGGRDSCTMRPSSLGPDAGEVWLRVDCHNTDQTYWCEYRGQPSMCQAFVADPKPYWNQALQELRRLHHACQGAPVLRPSVCRKAGPQAHMQQVTSSLNGSPVPNQQPEAGTPSLRPKATVKLTEATQLGKDSMEELGKAKPTTLPTAKATEPGPRPGGNEEAKKKVWEHCWKPFQALCAFLISFFQG